MDRGHTTGVQIPRAVSSRFDFRPAIPLLSFLSTVSVKNFPQNHDNGAMKIPMSTMTVALNSEIDIVPNCGAADPFDGDVLYLKPPRTAVIHLSKRLKHTMNFRARMHSWCCITAEDV